MITSAYQLSGGHIHEIVERKGVNENLPSRIPGILRRLEVAEKHYEGKAAKQKRVSEISTQNFPWDFAEH